MNCAWVLGAALIVGAGSAATAGEGLEWARLPGIPDRLGFAGAFAGVSGDALIVGGGANFPEKMPWDGGVKVWYDSVFVLGKGEAAWRTGFRLPAARGYGASVSIDDGVLCIGGSDAARHYADVWLLRWTGQTVEVTPYPPLPAACANLAAARAGDVVYVAGGMASPDAAVAMGTFWALDLKKLGEGWRALASWPGAERMLAVAGAREGAFYLFSGARLVAGAGAGGKVGREYLRDAYRYTPGEGWKRIADLPRAAVAAPSPAAVVGERLLVVSGDDGAHVNSDLRERHPGFPKSVLAYDAGKDVWRANGETAGPLVTTPLVAWGEGFVVPGGEARPGVRSTEVWVGKVRRKVGVGAWVMIIVFTGVALYAFGRFWARRRQS